MSTVSIASRVVVVLLAVYATAIVRMPPATGYEYSIYQSVPAGVWALFGLLLVVGIGLLAAASVERDLELAIPGVGAIIGAYTGFYALPTARGWEFISQFGADEFVHLGIVTDVVANGAAEDVIYPATHLLYAQLSLVIGVEPRAISWVVTLLFFVLFVVGAGYCALALSGDTRVAICALIASLPLFFGIYRLTIMPWLYAYIFLFAGLVCLEQYSSTGRSEWVAVFTIMMLGLMFYHPFTMLFGFVALGVYVVSRSLANRRSVVDRTMVLPVVIVGVVFVGWHSYHGTFDGYPRRVLRSLFTASENPGGGVQTAERAGDVEYTVSQLLYHFVIPNWGVLLVVFLAAGIVVLWVHGRSIRRSERESFDLFVTTQYVIGGLSAVTLLVVQLYGSNVFRMTQYLVFASIFAIGLGLARLVSVASSRHRRLVVVVGIVLLCGPFVVLDAGTAYGTDNQLSTAATEGYEWRLETTDLTQPTVADTGRDVYPYYYYSYDTVNTHDRSEPQTLEIGDGPARHDVYPFSFAEPPHRLGYHESASIEDAIAFESDVYLVTHDGDREWWQHEPEWRYGELTYHTDDDHEQLHADRAANRIYANDELDVWTVETASALDRQ